MPIWAIGLLFVGVAAVVAVAVAAKRPTTETDVDRVVAHALMAEGNTVVLRKLQYALSHAGRWAQAETIMKRAFAIDARNAREIQLVLQQSQAPLGQGGQVITATPPPQAPSVMQTTQFQRF
jgi:hypothetical protein